MNATTPDIPWVEKYRPMKVKDVVYQDTVKRTLQNVVDTGNMPHCLFHGPPGTGKTSAGLALCREVFGDNLFRRRVLELNASDERGIAVVRDKVKTWSRTVVIGGQSSASADSSGSQALETSSAPREIPGWKVVILDEADLMTPDAQGALRRVIEDNSTTTRFIIICNYLSKIIDPIASRCAKYRFEPISKAAQVQRLRFIATSEKVSLEPEAIEEILEISQGDLRVSITYMQSATNLASSEVHQGAGVKIGVDTIRAVAGFPPPSVATGILDSCCFPLLGHPSCDILDLQSKVTADGWDVNYVLKQILLQAIASPKLTDIQKCRIATAISESQHRLTQGAFEALQLLYVLAVLQEEGRLVSTTTMLGDKKR